MARDLDCVTGAELTGLCGTTSSRSGISEAIVSRQLRGGAFRCFVVEQVNAKNRSRSATPISTTLS
jgi:hypothetical protein